MFSLQILIKEDFRIIEREKIRWGVLGPLKVPQWVQAKALVGDQGGEDPWQKMDLVDFDMLLREFPRFKIVSFLSYLH